MGLIKRKSLPPDLWVRKQVVLIGAPRRELRDNRPFVAALKPVLGIRRDRVLQPGREHDFVPDRVGVFPALRRFRLRAWRRFTFNVKEHLPPAAAEGLLLA